jgi:adenylate kinase family enzyme
MGSAKNIYKKILPDFASKFLILTSINLLQKTTVRSAIRGQVRKTFTGKREKLPYERVPSAEHYADVIMETLNGNTTFPLSICIDGLPGSGKSTIGRALAERCNLNWRTLRWKELQGTYPFKKGRIYENIRLIRTQNIEGFDIVIYIDCPEEVARKRVITRDRNGTLADVVDFTKLKKIGDTAFKMLDGEEVIIGKSPLVRIKKRPKEGYRDLERLKEFAQESGIDANGFTKEELLFIYCYGKPQSGLSPYLNLGAYNNEILSGLYDALMRSLGRKYLT